MDRDGEGRKGRGEGEGARCIAEMGRKIGRREKRERKQR